MTIQPAREDYPDYFERYVALVPDGKIIRVLEDGQEQVVSLFGRVAPANAGFRYAEGKWSVREVLGHIIDTERVFAYRALRIARGDVTALTPFDQDLFVAGAEFERLRLPDLIDEFVIVRQATLMLFRHLTSEAWDRRGRVEENPLTPRAAAWIIAGHQLYHEALLREHYGAVLEDA
jgi:hypothetical protein